MKLVIDRAKWLHGESGGSSYLRRPVDGKMCCLGFYAEALGVCQGALDGVKMPRGLSTASKALLPLWLLGSDSFEDVSWLSVFNDVYSGDTGLPEAIFSDLERESKIAEYFAKHGVEVEFTGSY